MNDVFNQPLVGPEINPAEKQLQVTAKPEWVQDTEYSDTPEGN